MSSPNSTQQSNTPIAHQEISEDEYSQVSDIEHIWNFPDMVLSSDEHCQRVTDGLNFETGMIEPIETDIPPAVVQLPIEAIMNAADHIERSRIKGCPERPNGLPSMEVDMDFKRITVTNYGVAMPIGVHKQYGVHTPQFLFGNLRSSSNYQPGLVRTGIGRNGYGIKAVGIFSEEFSVDIVNMAVGSRYKQTWTGTKLQNVSEPEITPIEDGVNESSVSVSFVLDFERFKMDPEVGFPIEFFSMIAYYVMIISHSHKVVTRFNKLVFNNQHILELAAKIYPPEVLATSVVHYQLDPRTERVIDVNGVPTPALKRGADERIIVPKVELLIVDPSLVDEYKVISCVNGMLTDDGGVHVDAFLNQITPKIVKKVNSKDKEKETKSKATNGKKPAPKKKETGRKIQITAKDVKPSIVGILVVRVDNPKFDSQIKNRLKSPVPEISIPESILQPVFDWGFMERLDAILKGLEAQALSKTDGKKTSRVKMDAGFDANLAGTKRSNECTLILAEGISAMGYVVDYISQFPQGRDIYGVYPLRGKLLNTRKANTKRILKNREIADLKRIIGIKEGLNDRNNLRYHKVMIMTDADPDGSHITALIANVFDHLYGNLLESGFIVNYRTKYLRAVKGAQKKDFYTESEFEEWKNATPNWKTWKFYYFKGLGTSETADVQEDAANPKIIGMSHDEGDSRNFERLFGKSGADSRKEWLEEVRAIQNNPYSISNMTEMSFSTFFNREFSKYALMSLERAIPQGIDTLKHCQRQIIWGVMQTWKGKGPFTKMKVAQLCAKIAEMVSYKHGEQAMSAAIIHMASDYIGSNNLPLLVPRGQFGSRFHGGADAASPRYVATEPSEFFYLVFRKEDLPILERIEDEGEQLEPRFLYPIVPIGFINGSVGVALGHSTSIVNYNPRDITEYIIWWIKKNYQLGRANKKTPEIIPSFIGFTGEIILHKDAKYDTEADLLVGEGVDDTTLTADTTPNDQDDDEETDPSDEIEQVPTEDALKLLDDTDKKCDMIEMVGVFSILDNGDVHVTELPPGRWTINYYRWLDTLRQKKIIKDFVDNSTKTKINFLIKGMANPNARKLGLVKKIRLSNITLLDKYGIPVKYNTIHDYLDNFCQNRIIAYEKRYKYYIHALDEKIQDISERIRFIRAVVDEEIIVNKRDDKDIKADMVAMGIKPEYYDAIKLRELSEQGFAKNQAEYNTIVEEKRVYESKTPAEIWKDELMELSRKLKRHDFLDRTHEIEVRYNRTRQMRNQPVIE
jgi:DNA topoisomerase-2